MKIDTSKTLVFLQYFLIIIILIPYGNKTDYFYLGITISILALIVGILAIKTQTIGNFNIRPTIKDNSKLITHGIYKYIRHPMYLSVIIGTFGILICNINSSKIIFFIQLVATIMIKLYYEEKLWIQHDKEYNNYIKSSKRLIPFIF